MMALKQMSEPKTARKIRRLGLKRGFVVGLLSWLYIIQLAMGQSNSSANVEDALVPSITTEPVLIEKNGKLYQPVLVSFSHSGQPAEFTFDVSGVERITKKLGAGTHTIETLLPAVEVETVVKADLKKGGKTLLTESLMLKPVRKWSLYFLPHSHVDIGYTHVQSEVERIQWQHFEKAIELAQETSDYPDGSRFKWNVEVLWAVDGYLKQASRQKRQEFIDAVKAGSIGLDALYGNELTGLCRPEELVQLVSYAHWLERTFSVTIDSAMITDVPGFTWGIVQVLSQSGVKYLSSGPNYFARIGYSLLTWGDRPFYWVSPCGRHKVLCWVAAKGYSWFHEALEGDIEKAGARTIFEYLKELQDSGYPYDVAHFRYNIGGDNGPPDPNLPRFVKNWNAKYAYPRLLIATTSEMFREFERLYAAAIPTFRGDFTPYWEDGAASSARETALNRATAERLVQAETLWAMLNLENYPVEELSNTWRNIVLYDEHTWGAWNSISEPESDFTKAQWNIKQAFALDADAQSRKLLDDALAGHRSRTKNVMAVDVFNTLSWLRTDVVVLPQETVVPGHIVKGPDGEAVPSQLLSTGELAFLARDVCPFSAKRFTIHPGKSDESGEAKARGTKLSNDNITLTVDKKTGTIASLTCKELGSELNLVNCKAGEGLNDYLYVAGQDPENAKRNGQVKITMKEPGPLVASLLIESEAPGCHKLAREVRLVDGLDRIDIINVIDKQKTYSKEGVRFGFAFNIPDGTVRIDTPWATVRPELDQLEGANKNYFTVQRWVDISNRRFGVTWATVDAPLLEVGGLTAPTSGANQPSRSQISQEWNKSIHPSQTVYSYVMNNYWWTNYKASQDGPTLFRYSIEPHRKFDSGRAARFGIERSQPFIVVPVDRKTPLQQSLLKVEPADVIVTALRHSEDGKVLIVRLFNAGEQPREAKVAWAQPKPAAIWLSNLWGGPISKMTGPIEMVPGQIKTLRVLRNK